MTMAHDQIDTTEEEAWVVRVCRYSGRGRHWDETVLARSKDEAIQRAEKANPGYRAISARNDQ